MPKYLITEKETKKQEIVESRTKPNLDSEKFEVTRHREKVEVITSNQKKRMARGLSSYIN